MYAHFKRGKWESFLLLVLLIGLLLVACQANNATQDVTENNIEDNTFAGKKVLFVNSYHNGYEWSDGIETGIFNVLDGTGIDIHTIELDTKRHTDEGFRQESAQQALRTIESYQPDIIIAADDNAQSYLVVPYLMDEDTPIIFVGVNWDASIYGYPSNHITGMVEIELVEELINHLREYASGDQVGYLTVNSDTERKVADEYNKRFFDGSLRVFAVSSLEEFKEVFVSAQSEVDMLFIGNNAGIEDWDETKLESFFVENTTIPTGSINPWMAPYSLVTLAKVPEEQGEWAAETTLHILEGTSISDIPVVENKIGHLILHLDIAERLDIIFPPSLLKNAEVYSISQ